MRSQPRQRLIGDVLLAQHRDGSEEEVRSFKDAQCDVPSDGLLQQDQHHVQHATNERVNHLELPDLFHDFD